MNDADRITNVLDNGEHDMTTTHAVKNEELLDELYVALQTLVHYYRGMMRDMAEDNYTVEQAERDWTALTYNDHTDVVSLLAEIMKEGES